MTVYLQANADQNEQMMLQHSVFQAAQWMEEEKVEEQLAEMRAFLNDAGPTLVSSQEGDVFSGLFLQLSELIERLHQALASQTPVHHELPPAWDRVKVVVGQPDQDKEQIPPESAAESGEQAEEEELLIHVQATTFGQDTSEAFAQSLQQLIEERKKVTYRLDLSRLQQHELELLPFRWDQLVKLYRSLGSLDA